MKNSLIMILLISTLVNTRRTQPDTKEYIEFENIGAQAKYFPPVFISKRKLDLKLNAADAEMFKDEQSRHPGMTKDDFLMLWNDFLITDANTYSMLLSFITSHNEFYSRFPYNLYPEGDIDIIANGKKYNLCYKTQKEYFRKLIDSLKEKNCEEKVVVRLGHIH